MGLLLDMKTIFITLVVGHVLTVVLITAYWNEHRKDKTITTFFVSKCLQAVAWLFLVLRGGIPDLFTVSFANSLLFIGTSLETIAVLMYFGVFEKRLKKLYLLLTTVSVFGFHFILFFINNENYRIAFASLASATFIIAPIIHFFRLFKESHLIKILGVLYSLVMLSLVSRGFGALFSDYALGLFTPGFYQTISFLSIYLVMILGNMGFILLLKERSDKEIIRLASMDDLTNIYNRRTFISLAEKYMKNCREMNQPFSFILFDVDHFKAINDTFGHVMGDTVLQDLCDKISSFLGPNDLFGRYGGDEFAIMLPRLDINQSFEIAENIRIKAQESKIGSQEVTYTLSIGLMSVDPDRFVDFHSLYMACDQVLYSAKRNGRNNVSQKTYKGSNNQPLLKYQV